MSGTELIVSFFGKYSGVILGTRRRSWLGNDGTSFRKSITVAVTIDVDDARFDKMHGGRIARRRRR